MTAGPEIDSASPLQFVINAAAGSSDADTKREVIETALQVAGRRAEFAVLRISEPLELFQQAENALEIRETARAWGRELLADWIA